MCKLVERATVHFTSADTPWLDCASWPDNMPKLSTMNSWLFPPQTREVQFDEMWGFVTKKEKRCDKDDPRDDQSGDNWDHVGFDAEHRLVLSVVPGERTLENCCAVVNEVKQRLGDRKTRKSYCFSKNARMHEAVTYFTTYSDNFCWPVRTLRTRDEPDGVWKVRTPAMAAGLADRVWTVEEWLSFPAVQRR